MNRALLLHLSIRRYTQSCGCWEESVCTEMEFFGCCFIRGLKGAEFLKSEETPYVKEPLRDYFQEIYNVILFTYLEEYSSNSVGVNNYTLLFSILSVK